MSSDGVSIDDLFRRPNEQSATESELRTARARMQAAFGNARARDASYLRNRELQQTYGDMVTPRMQQAAELRARAEREQVAPAEVPVAESPARPAFMIDWYNAEYWTVPEGAYPISKMDDQHLWKTIVWCVRNVEALYKTYEQAPANAVPALASRKWLRLQTAFRSLLRESLRRQLTFPPDVHEYVRKYMLGKDDELTTYEPWNDPTARMHQQELQAFMDEPVEAPEDYGKNQRVIDL